MSTMFLHTLREEPADAEVPSHRLLVRAGYVRRLAPGIYSWLPLGKQVLDNVASVVREEMDALGGQEVLFPALLPREFYEATGRERGYGDLLFRVTDRRGGHYVLGPTHEELFTAMVKGECSSYRDLPLTLYQIQAKYRDEARPRAGLLRGREFVMKDSYSFDLDEDGLQDSYNRHRAAYMRIFNRLGLDYRVVRAVAGAMGGTHSEQFLAPSPSGEDTYVCCTTCDFAANTEAVPYRPGASQRGAHGSSPHPPMRVLDTPAAATIEALSARLRLPAAAMLKNLLVTVTEPDGRTATVGIGVPGDREVDLRRVEAALAPAVVRAYTEQDFAARPELVRGHVGPQGLAGAAFRYLADPRVAVGTSWVTGANEPDRHVRDAVVGRDFTVDRYVDVVAVRDEDPCPSCGGSLRVDRGIEVGHIFQLGRRYADVFDLDVLGPDGRQVRVTMGSYGIGLSRLVAAIAEQTFDDDGLCWPATVAPADVHVVAAGRDDTVHAAAAGLADQLAERGNRVILDDRRAVSAGVKFTDAELIGVPVIVVVGRGLADGTVEVRHRRTGRRCAIAPTEVAEAVNRRVEAG